MPLIQWDWHTLKGVSGPVIYMWKRGETVLYVGSSDHGLRRILTHNVIGKVEPFLETDVLEILPCPDILDFIGKEQELIKQHRPKYNMAYTTDKGFLKTIHPAGKYGVCPMCRSEFKRKRSWQMYCSNECRNATNVPIKFEAEAAE